MLRDASTILTRGSCAWRASWSSTATYAEYAHDAATASRVTTSSVSTGLTCERQMNQPLVLTDAGLAPT
jgi:hypothetical protein